MGRGGWNAPDAPGTKADDSSLRILSAYRRTSEPHYSATSLNHFTGYRPPRSFHHPSTSGSTVVHERTYRPHVRVCVRRFIISTDETRLRSSLLFLSCAPSAEIERLIVSFLSSCRWFNSQLEEFPRTKGYSFDGEFTCDVEHSRNHVTRVTRLLSRVSVSIRKK